MTQSLRWRGILAAVAASGLAATAIGASAFAQPSGDDALIEEKVDAAILAEVDAAGEADVWVRFQGSPDYSDAHDADTKVDKGTAAVAAAKQFAETSQADAITVLEEAGAAYASYWGSSTINTVADEDLLAELALLDSVEAIVEAPEIELIEPVASPVAPAAAEWGVANINAPDVWDLGYTGEGIVVATIDTGVQYDHPALVDQYRGDNGDGTFTHDYNFFDVQGVCGDEPCDTAANGHGTHVTGTMVGDDGEGDQIGVAPGAEWIAVNGCCPSIDAVIAAGEWIAAPTDSEGGNPDPAMAPHVVNNSWGTVLSGYNPFYEEIVDLWHASGIIPVFAGGNNGFGGCETMISAGIYSNVIGVGAYDIDDVIADFSSRGPGLDGRIKPDVSGPGVDVRSALPGDTYGTLDGTSMAAPHVTGMIALMMDANEDLIGDYDAVYEIVTGTARPTPDDQCGSDGDANNVYGHGRVDALAAVEAALTEPPQIEVAPTSISESVHRDASVTRAIAVTNAGSAAVEIDLVVGDGGFSVLGLEDPTDTSWLSVAEESIVVEPGETRSVEVTLSAHEEFGVDQPGHYTAVITLDAVRASPPPTVDVTMLALVRPGEGKVFGDVRGRTCDGGLVNLAGAEVDVLSSTGVEWSLTTGGTGGYAVWVDPGTTEVSAAAEGFASEADEVEVFPGGNHWMGFELQELGC